MTADPQLPLEPTVRIDPLTLVEHMPGTDAVCMCGVHVATPYPCLWPFCAWKQHLPEQDAT